MESVAEKILSSEEIKPGVYKCCVETNPVSLERLGVLNESSTEVSHGPILHKRGVAVKNLQ